MIGTLAVVVVVVGSMTVGAIATIWLQRTWRRMRERIAGPLVQEHEQRFRNREALIRECARECVDSVISGQRDAIGALAREGFSAMVELNRDLLSEVRTMRSALFDARQVTIVKCSSHEPLYRLPHRDWPQQELTLRRRLVDRLMFWRKRGA